MLSLVTYRMLMMSGQKAISYGQYWDIGNFRFLIWGFSCLCDFNDIFYGLGDSKLRPINYWKSRAKKLTSIFVVTHLLLADESVLVPLNSSQILACLPFYFEELFVPPCSSSVTHSVSGISIHYAGAEFALYASMNCFYCLFGWLCRRLIYH